MRFRFWVFFGLAALLFGGLPSPARAQAEAAALSEEYSFGGQIVFRASFPLETAVAEAVIFIHVEGEEQTITASAAVEPGVAHFTLDLTRQPLRAFTSVTYWFQLDEIKTVERQFFYEDNRFDWQTAEDAPFRVHWYDGDAAFGQMLRDAAGRGLAKAQRYLPVTPPTQVDIYAYASAAEMQSTLQLGGIQWAAGHADPDLGVMVVSLPPGPSQFFEAKRQIPHELMHILLYQWMGEAYPNLPAWLNEGLASLNESEANPDYYTLLKNASEKDALLPLAALCTRFPQDASSALLAYAQAESFTRYLIEQYGVDALQTLLGGYLDGLSCERGVEAAYGQTLEALEQQWRQAIREPALPGASLAEFAPWAALMGAGLAAPLLASLAALRKTQRARPAGG